MKALFLVMISLFLVTALFAQGYSPKTKLDAFDDTVSWFDVKDAKTLSQCGSGAIFIKCTLLPRRAIFGIAWEIENPQRKTLNISPEDIRTYDQVRSFGMLRPEEACDILFGKKVSSRPIPSPEVDSRTPLASLVPKLQPRSQAEKDVYSSAFNFGQTNAAHIKGITYLNRYGPGERLTAEMNVDGETFKFEF